jgi:hypothetical protein
VTNTDDDAVNPSVTVLSEPTGYSEQPQFVVGKSNEGSWQPSFVVERSSQGSWQPQSVVGKSTEGSWQPPFVVGRSSYGSGQPRMTVYVLSKEAAGSLNEGFLVGRPALPETLVSPM